MKNLRELWGARFLHYITEFQKYMKYVFTGHLAIVLIFTIGAGGYAYSEWLKEVPIDFPSALLTALLIGAVVTYSPPVTLLKPADAVYFLPMETKLHTYLGQALRWTTFSQLPLPFIIYIVLLPLLAATDTGSKMILIWLAIFIVILKWGFVETEYFVRHAMSGKHIWLDRLLRFTLVTLLIYSWLSPYPYLILLLIIPILIYGIYWRKMKSYKPFPYDHFISLEQNRMMRFYRFANYFTDVPHLKGSVSRRAWLSFLIGPPKYGSGDTQSYLVKRTFLRTDDLFWLWVRLTAISLVGALFISIPIVIYVFSGALAFASSIQLIYALRAGEEFRMDMLFPEKTSTRPAAIRKIVRSVQWIQAFIVLIAAFFAFGLALQPFLLMIIIVVLSELTIQFTKEKSN